ncbi:claudin-23 [Alosa sapidissima]|uniref:claudin-23 n=1 Tax=Alosa sapidissima TaxID=34773 RepID=UPI001C08BC2F|nr:claudin-23 [Alosa sapidissima]XP_041944845.1 claudin-23 [Alosa sapidissima]XP_041944849.1 claudin-23 [Alosa sapidissima]
MQTPVSMVMGIVFAPLGLVLVFTAAITPQWREGQVQVAVGPGGIGGVGGVGVGEGLLLLRSDGLWESCLQVAHSELKQCWPASGPYQRDRRVRAAQGLVLASLFSCGAGIVLASLFSCGAGIVLASVGVRRRDRAGQRWRALLRGVAAGGGGLLVVLAGLLSLVALGLYTHNLAALGSEDPAVSGGGVGGPRSALQQHQRASSAHRLPRLSLRPAGSLYFGWVGGWVQVLGGAALMLSFKRPHCPSCHKRPPVDNTETYEVAC